MDSTANQLMAQLRQNPLDPDLLDTLRRHCETVGDVTTWAEALEHHARAADHAEADPVELGRLHFELGNLYRDQLGRSDRAITHYRSAIDFDPAQRPAITAARAIFASAGKWDQVERLLSLEAESLPAGPKKTALLKERANVLKQHLGDPAAAIEALREAVISTADDLGLQHELATQLLDQADATNDRPKARMMRREAADLLCAMARNVSDDYAFAYVEAALDAVPDHEGSLRCLQTVAPRLGRADSIPARWVASLQYAPDGPLSRELRLKLAIAYRTAGQKEDARICLQPLVDRGDPEARALAAELGPRTTLVPEERKSRPPERASHPPEAGARPNADADNAALFRTEVSAERPSQAEAGGLSSALDDLEEPSAHGSNPLSDLATLAPKTRGLDSDDADAERTIIDAHPVIDADPADIDDDESDSSEEREEELSASGLEEIRDEEDITASGLEEAKDDDAVTAPGLEELKHEEEITASGLEEVVQDEQPRPANAEPRGRREGRISDVPEREELTTSGVEELRRLITSVGDHAASADEEPPTSPPRGSISERETVPPEAAAAATHDEDEEDVTAVAFEEIKTQSAELEPESHAVDDVEELDLPSAAANERRDADLPEEDTKPRGDGRASRAPIAHIAAPETRRDSKPSPRRTSAPPPRGSAPPPRETPPAETVDPLTQLRRELARRVRFRDRRGAAEIAEKLLALGHLDPDAISALEEQYRMTRDFRRLRDLTMRIADDHNVPVEQRLGRLREAAMLSESKLGDVDGTIIAWRAVLELAPLDEEANNKLRRLLTRLSRWDDLGQLLASRAEADPDPVARADRYRELATLHRERRKSLDDAIAALERARVLDPGELSDAAALCDLYSATGRPDAAANMFEWRIAHTAEPVERVPLLVTLADLYENDLRNLEAAYASAEALLQIAPRHVPSLDRLLRIDEQLGRWENVIRVLENKLAMSDAAGRVRLQVRIAEIALQQLNNPERSADAYASAIEVTPDDRGLFHSAAEAFERAGRREELTESIATAAQHARDATKRFDLYQMVAERRESDGDLSAAIAAREGQLAVRRDRQTLRQLVALLRQTDRAQDLVRRLDELARMEAAPEARELRLERAAVLAEQLTNLEAAKGELQRVLNEVAPDDMQVLEMLIDLCRRSDDVLRRTEAQAKLIRLTPSIEAKVDLSTDLVETFESVGDAEGAMRTLRTWIGFSPESPQPYLRLAPLLAAHERREELLSTYDALTRLSMTEEEAGEYQLRAARIAFELQDYEGAWNRLVPRVVDADDEAAEALLEDVARAGDKADALAELYVGLAQRDDASEAGKQRWIDAARIYETLGGQFDKALEAILRAFAKDLDDAALLSEAERLTELANAWPRLSQVYDALVRRAPSAQARIACLMRHSALLEERAKDPQAALARAALACQVDPSADAPYEEATRLAKALEAHETLLALHEQRAMAPVSVEARLAALLDACETARMALDDLTRATSYLARSIVSVGTDEGLLDYIEARIAQLDADRPEPHGRGLVYALSEAYAREAEESVHDQTLSGLLWARAAALRDNSLSDPVGAYHALEQASAKKLQDEALLDALIELASRAGQLEALARHLTDRAENAIDSSTASAAFTRLGDLYEGPLSSPALAAEAFAQLVKLNPRDPVACGRLRRALAAGDKHKELLLAIERELSLSPDPETRLALLKESAQVWERDLQNRFEALDAWRKVLAQAPDDVEAKEAVERLRTRPKLDDSSLLDADLVVRPEDLLPSLPPVPTASEASEAATTEELPGTGELAASDDASVAPDAGEAGEAAQPARAEGVDDSDAAAEPAGTLDANDPAQRDETGHALAAASGTPVEAEEAQEATQTAGATDAEALSTAGATDAEALSPDEAAGAERAALASEAAAPDAQSLEHQADAADPANAAAQAAQAEAAGPPASGAEAALDPAAARLAEVAEIAARAEIGPGRAEAADAETTSEDDDEGSELERAVLEASHAHAEPSEAESDAAAESPEPVADEGSETLDAPSVAVSAPQGDQAVEAAGYAASEPEKVSEPSDEDATLVAEIDEVQRLAASPQTGLASSDAAPSDDDSAAAEPLAEPAAAESFDALDEELDAYLEEDTEAADLDSLSSILGQVAQRGSSGGRIPPPPPARSPSVPPDGTRSVPPPKGIRPPPPPRRD